MKHATFVFAGIAALCLASFAGCGSKTSSSQAVYTPPAGEPKMGQALKNAPELKIKSFETPQDKANYLKSLASDKNFDPKMHVPFLEEQAKDSDPDVANAAKDLLDRAK